jgi:hypothetical protein
MRVAKLLERIAILRVLASGLERVTRRTFARLVGTFAFASPRMVTAKPVVDGPVIRDLLVHLSAHRAALRRSAIETSAEAIA